MANTQEIVDDVVVHFALRPQKRNGLLGTGTGGRGRKSEGSTADTVRKRPARPWPEPPGA